MNFPNVRLNFINGVVDNVTFFPSAFEEGCIDLENESISHIPFYYYCCRLCERGAHMKQ